MKTFLTDKWQFNPGYAAGQEKSILADGIAFELDEEHRINLDVLLDRPGKVEDDGIVYNRFHLDSETGLAFGLGCDWWAEVWLNGEKENLCFYTDGCVQTFDEEKALALLSAEQVRFSCCMHMGNQEATAWGCDLTYDYVRINGDYRS